MERQVMIQGTATKVPAAESDDYFATRPWGSQIGAWASAQSSLLANRADLEERQAEFAAKYPEGSPVPRPEHWGGYIVAPTTIELWQGRYSRLHDRVRYIQTNGGWDIQRFYP
jgi:pyridoxamine 5'-phosphate oxidase